MNVLYCANCGEAYRVESGPEPMTWRVEATGKPVRAMLPARPSFEDTYQYRLSGELTPRWEAQDQLRVQCQASPYPLCQHPECVISATSGRLVAEAHPVRATPRRATK